MISMVILTVGLVSVLGVFGLAMASTQTSQVDMIAKQLANEAYESIVTARNTSQISWDAIQNTTGTQYCTALSADAVRATPSTSTTSPGSVRRRTSNGALPRDAGVRPGHRHRAPGHRRHRHRYGECPDGSGNGMRKKSGADPSEKHPGATDDSRDMSAAGPVAPGDPGAALLDALRSRRFPVLRLRAQPLWPAGAGRGSHGRDVPGRRRCRPPRATRRRHPPPGWSAWPGTSSSTIGGARPERSGV